MLQRSHHPIKNRLLKMRTALSRTTPKMWKFSFTSIMAMSAGLYCSYFCIYLGAVLFVGFFHCCDYRKKNSFTRLFLCFNSKKAIIFNKKFRPWYCHGSCLQYCGIVAACFRRRVQHVTTRANVRNTTNPAHFPANGTFKL